MQFNTVGLSVAALALATAPTALQAASQRAAAPPQETSELRGSGWIIGILALAAIIAAIIIATKGEHDPVSP